MKNLISTILIISGIIILTEPLKSINANTDDNNIQEQITTPKRLNINIAIDSPEDIKVNEGDEIKKGQIIATRDKTKNQLLSQREQLLSSLNKVKTLKPLPPTAPLEVPPLSILPPISYLEYEAEIEKKKETRKL